MKTKCYVECGYLPHSINLVVECGRVRDFNYDITQVHAKEILNNIQGSYEVVCGDKLAAKMLGLLK